MGGEGQIQIEGAKPPNYADGGKNNIKENYFEYLKIFDSIFSFN
jgi:hypothetical protein